MKRNAHKKTTQSVNTKKEKVEVYCNKRVKTLKVNTECASSVCVCVVQCVLMKSTSKASAISGLPFSINRLVKQQSESYGCTP